MIRLTDTALAAIRTDSEQGIAPGMGDIQLMLAELTQLKAENKRLRSDYAALSAFNPDWDKVAAAQDSVREKMAMVNELKAECEGLRVTLIERTDSLHGEMLQKFRDQLPDEMHPVTRREYDRDMAEVAGYRAAMSKGERS